MQSFHKNTLVSNKRIRYRLSLKQWEQILAIFLLFPLFILYVSYSVPKSLLLFLHIYDKIASSFVNAGAYSGEFDFSCIRSNTAVYWMLFT